MLIGQNISIVGAGIGGLTAAIALAHRGAQVTVFEQAPEIKEVGAGLQISPNGFTVLRALGLGDALAEIARRGSRVSLLEGHAGREVFALDLTVNGADFPYYFVHRADLINLLADAAKAAGVTIRLGKSVESVDISPTPKLKLKLKGGEVQYSDIVIGADGLHSIVRQALNGTARPKFTGQVAWRAVVPTPEHAGRDTTVRVYMGPKRHMVCYPLRDGSITNIVAVQERSEWAAEGWNHPDNPENVRAVFKEFCPSAQQLLERVEDVNLWGLFRHPVAANWHDRHVAILGDAAHPTLPFMAQGAVMALEDAWVLAEALATEDNISIALQHYQNARFSRVSRVIEAASKNARNYHLERGPFRTLAHGVLKVGSHLAPRLAARQFDWIYTHDVTKQR
ncbi:FAD-dependent monooxygenase [Falsihalocynthiibacter sp. SS001]|uniref:FAD-dependent monooxygenase n=1 Tax=Falsihalocynthiibacter sp. SS001 TaxID=3349698 RepID=UPI0036D24617